MERELSAIREREEKALVRAKDLRVKEEISIKASAEAAAARSRYTDKEAERLAKAEQSYTKQIKTLELQLEAAEAITREDKKQAELQLRLLQLRNANKDLTDEQLRALEQATTALFNATNLSPIEQYMKDTNAALADTEAMIVSLAKAVESSLATAMSTAVTSLVTGAQTIEKTLSDMFAAIGKAFIDMATQMIAKALVMKALGILSPGSTGSTGGYGTGLEAPISTFRVSGTPKEAL